MRGRSARMPYYIAAEARGHSPAPTPRWSPHFRTMWVCAVCALLELNGDVRVRWIVDGELPAVVLTRVEALRQWAGGDSMCEVGKQTLKVQYHPGTQRPSSPPPRSRQVDRNSRGCRL